MMLSQPKHKIILTYGTFDLFHIGHVNLLKNAHALGEKLIVGLSTDEFNTNEKNKHTIFPYQQRKEILESNQYVDLVIPENNWEQKIVDIKKHKVDAFIMGDDWKGKFDYLNEYCSVIYLPRTKGVSTTDIKIRIKKDGYVELIA